MTELEHLVEHCEQHEQNVYDFEDIRFAEIYLEDITPTRKALKQRKMKKEKHYD
jgi:hypothetical protein